MITTGSGRVLLVDDDSLSARPLAELLAQESAFACDIASEIDEAERLLGIRPYAAILLSLTLSRHAGLPALALLQSIAPQVPIIVLSGPDQEAVALKALQCGAADYLLRSQIYPTRVIRSLKHAIETRRAQERQAETERALKWERDFNAAVITTAGCLIVVLDRAGRIVEFNRTCERITGYRSARVRGHALWEFLIPEAERAEVQRGFGALVAGHYPATHENHWIGRDGLPHLIAWSNTALVDQDGAVEFVIATGIPVTEHRQAEEALRQSETKYRGLFEQSRDAIIMTDSDGAIVEVNGATHELLGFPSGELLCQPLDCVFEDPADRVLFREEWNAKRSVTDFEVRVRRHDASARWCLISVAERCLPNGRLIGYQGILHDITDRKRAEERLIHNAYHDVLTGLPNRSLFKDRLDRALARWHREHDQLFAVMFIDLDRFKVVNDSLGHSAGDELLVRIARLIENCIRDIDTLARLGGDEFAILLDHCDSITDAVLVAERIHAALEQPLTVSGQSLFTTCSIGIALPSVEIERASDLLRNADIAMYRAKAEGAARHATYAPAMYSDAVNVMELDMDLRAAIQERQFVLHYQPIFALESGIISGFEALLRWRHPRRGLLWPKDFLERAEETGVIIPIGRWVVREVCDQLRAWSEQNSMPGLPFVSINISGKSVAQADFVSEVAAALRERQIPGDRLMFELTETSLMQSPDSCALTIHRLRDLGVRFCIDDFGTGYSSLSYLHRLPINGLKIDRSFINRLDNGQDGAELVGTIVTLAENLGLYAVAEGVETELQLTNLRALGPKYVQGFLLSRPLDPAAAMAMLAANASS
ncbi:MAG TPA: EAL domain-containing protein [Longimicrobiales bacterium]|nr:EAL domain-containing protein [Longimicrobiales bacterium]